MDHRATQDFTPLLTLAALLALVAGLLFASGCVPVADDDDDDDTAGQQDPVEADREPEPLYSLDELMDALEGGRQVRATLYYGECLLDGSPGPDAIGGMAVETYEWFDEGVIGNPEAYVAFSKSSLIRIYNDHVFDYVKVRVYDGGDVQIIAEYLDPVTFAVEMYEEFECELDEGDGGSVSLFAL